MTPADLITLSEAAAMLGYAPTEAQPYNHISRVSQLIGRGVLVAYGDDAPRRRRVSRAEVEALRERRRQRAEATARRYGG